MIRAHVSSNSQLNLHVFRATLPSRSDTSKRNVWLFSIIWYHFLKLSASDTLLFSSSGSAPEPQSASSTLVALHDTTAEHEGAADDCEPDRKVEKPRPRKDPASESAFARLDGLGGSRGGRFDIVVQSMDTFSRHRSMYQNDYG